jgi:glycosyltransferase involved in cell wall biosynthesis
MSKTKILFVCHNHPSVRPGGAEAYAYELFRALRASIEFEPIFLAKAGPPLSPHGRPHEGTCIVPVNGAGDEYFFYSDDYQFDWLFGTMRDSKELFWKHYRRFLDAVQPDIVHFQHTLFLGYDLIRETKNALPHAGIVYTLHEFLPICHRQGQMVRVGTNEPCIESSPRRCHECFPDITPQAFFMRKRFVQSHFELVDLFLAPSSFLRERYIEWGIAPEKIRCEEYGRLPVVSARHGEPREQRDRLGFFGQLNPFKGIHVLLEAMALITKEERAGRPSSVTLKVHGANLDFQTHEFRREFDELAESTKDRVTIHGSYDHDQLSALIEDVDWVVVPSIWWENSPLVIQEAFAYGRPVICSDIGGMAEKVTDGLNGLHFRVGDPQALAATIRRAAESPVLWEQLREGIPPVYSMDDHIETLTRLFEEVRNGSRGGSNGR